jgi:hypothetical protein
MKALAGFIVGGRYQAILVASLSGILAFLLPPYSTLTNYLGAAAVALVTLRIGATQGLLVLVAATVLTVLFYQVAGEPAAVIAVTVLMLWLPCWLVSVVLRTTTSLAMAMLFAAALAIVVLLLVYLLHGDPAPWWYAQLQQIEALLKESALLQQGPSTEELLHELSRLMTGVVIASLELGAVCGVLLARWWQAMLFNPGGLRSEFCNLRFGQYAGIATLGTMIFSRLVEGPAGDLAGQIVMILLVPYLFAGLAVAHGLVMQLGRGKGWLVAVYVLLLIVPQATLLVAGGGLLDTWIDFRRRLGGAGRKPDDSTD